jgi:GDPmannose 4,6-dehydratase
MKKALITGIAGQDGSYLAEYLLTLGYDVHGIVRRNSITEHQQTRIDNIKTNIQVYYGDMLDQSSLLSIMKTVQPDEIYNLAAQSHVRISFDIPQFTAQTNAIGVLNILEATKQICPTARIYQASSSEMFGTSVDDDGYQRETTPMKPTSPYGCAKLFGYSIMRNYRHAYNMHASNGILFNHESSRRGANFISNKVVIAAVKIKLGLQDKLELGNMDAYRDWGCSKDYVKAMQLILQQDIPDDWVVATGETHSVRDMCKYVFNYLGLNYEDYIVQNEKFIRPEELPYLRGDSTKIRTTLGWKPIYTFETMLDEMIEYWLKIYS